MESRLFRIEYGCSVPVWCPQRPAAATLAPQAVAVCAGAHLDALWATCEIGGNEFLYRPDYPVGQMIAFQVEAQMDRAGDFGAEFERVARIGAVAPDLWMRQAAGAPVGPEALLAAAQEALLSAARNLPP